MRKTRSILEELNQISVDRDRDHVVSNRGEHIISSAISLLEQIDNFYDEATAKDLQNRLVKVKTILPVSILTSLKLKALIINDTIK